MILFFLLFSIYKSFFFFCNAPLFFSKDVEKSEENKDRDGIFRGIAIFVNGYTDPTADELKRIMMVNGGIYHHYKSSKTTHIIGKKHVI